MKTFNSHFSNHSMRWIITLIACVFFPVIAYSSGFTFTYKIKSTQTSTGSGTVYALDTKGGELDAKDDEEGLSGPEKEVELTTIDTWKDKPTSPWGYKVKYWAEANPGSYFAGFYESEAASSDLANRLDQDWDETEEAYVGYKSGTAAVVESYGSYTATAEATFYVKFVARTYVAHRQPKIKIITIGQDNSIIRDRFAEEFAKSVNINELTLADIPEGSSRSDVAGRPELFAQTADNYGEHAQASYEWEGPNNTYPYHTYAGWNDNEAYDPSKSGDIKLYTNVEMDENGNFKVGEELVEGPEQKTIYLFFKREKFNLLQYNIDNGEEKLTLVEPAFVDNDVKNYTFNLTDSEEQIYQIISGVSGEMTVESSTQDFNAYIENIYGVNILRINPNSSNEELSSVLTIRVGDTIVAVINITLTQSEEPIYITLNPAGNLEGEYSYQQKTTGSQSFTVTNTPIRKEMVNQSDYTFTFTPTAYENEFKYFFKRWRVDKYEKDSDGNMQNTGTVYYTEPNLSVTFTGGETITPEFESTVDRATFIVNGDINTIYYDLQLAIEAAKLTADKVVAVHTDGFLSQGDYVIDGGVTLLVPGTDAKNGKYEVLTRELDKNDYSKGSGTWKQYRTLVVEDGTTITVNDGNISLFAQLTAGTNGAGVVAGRPNNFGTMVLGKDCRILVENGNLYAYGYIIGDMSSEIIMEADTKVYEAFQLSDCRGGSAMLGIVNDGDCSAFPSGQYYVQNIEVPLTLKSGAEEYLSTAMYALSQVLDANALFIGKDTGKEDDKGLLCLGENTTLTKSYNPSTDRLQLSIKGPNAKISYMYLNMGVVKLDSRKYVMQIASNIDILIDGTNLGINYDLALMPGSSLKMLTKSSVNLLSGKRLYFYDHDERHFVNSDGTTTGYYYNNKEVKPLTYRPANTWTSRCTNNVGEKSNGQNMLYERSEKDLVDAKIVFNGEMTVDGALYTTKGGADITSEGSGTIYVNNVGTETVTKQILQVGTDYSLKDIPLSSCLKLHNRETNVNTTDYANQETYYKYSNYTDVTSKGTYIYYQKEGKWDAPKAQMSGYKLYKNIDESEEITSLNVTLPTAQAKGYLICQFVKTTAVTSYATTDFAIALEGTSAGFAIDNANISVIDGYKLVIPITYTAQNKHTNATPYTATLRITKAEGCTKNISVDESIIINACEDYTVAFNAPSALTARTTIKSATGDWQSYPLEILVDADNVLSLTEGANAVSSVDNGIVTLIGNYNENLVWTAQITGTNANQFSFEFGKTNNAIKNAVVLFCPTSEGKKSAVLTLTASYTDANSKTMSKTQTIQLSGEGVIADNTMDFASVGQIKVGTVFTLLKDVNSDGAITINVGETPVNFTDNLWENDYIKIEKTGDNYQITAKKIGEVAIQVIQEKTDYYNGKPISKNIIIQGDAQPLGTGVCVTNQQSFTGITADYEFVAFQGENETAKVLFNTSETTQMAKWALQFTTMPGYITFTPTGSGRWMVQESTNGMPGSWTDLMTWTYLESGKPIFLPVSPKTRGLAIYYDGVTSGELTDVCVYPLTLQPEANVIYVPIREGQINETITFRHNVGEGEILLSDNWGSATASSENLGGLLQVYFETEVNLVKSSVDPGTYNITARLGEYTCDLTIVAYEFPVDLPIQSEEWSNEFYHYMPEASHHLDEHYVKWNAEKKQVVFTTPCAETESVQRYVVFGFKGYPTQISFQTTTADWKIEWREKTEDSWNELTSDVAPVADDNGVYTLQRAVDYRAKYLQITHLGSASEEVSLYNLQVIGEDIIEIREPEPTTGVKTYAELIISKEGDNAAVGTFTIFTANMEQLIVESTSNKFTLKHGTSAGWGDMPEDNKLTNAHYSTLDANQAGEITFQVTWTPSAIVQEGEILIKNKNEEVVARVRVVGKKNSITANDVQTGIYTGVPSTHTFSGFTSGKFDTYIHKPVVLTNAFDGGMPSFDYLFIYGETTATEDAVTDEDGKIIITEPRMSGDKRLGSNAKTPYYVYKKNGNTYEFVQAIENANSPRKADLNIDDKVLTKDENGNVVSYAIKPAGNALKVYFTGFCPYATTGSSKDEEGVWYFQGKPGDELDIYLENCHIYSRNKSVEGGPTAKNISPSFGGTEVVLGSGAVFVFQNTAENTSRLKVSIHTIGHNLLKSNFGCYYTMLLDAQVTQVSSPVQIRLGRKSDYSSAYTTLNFDDIWLGIDGRTNGFLSLQKLVNNAPSIDLGNPNTILNFNGGQIELQNATIGSANYKTTMAISHRSGKFGNFSTEFAYGIGTDAVGGTVYFKDGTTTVQPMKVDAQYRSFYLMDMEQAKDENGMPKFEADGVTPVMVETATTSCLRTPAKTIVTGGSHCMMRACNNVTSKGGAPKDENGVALGLYKYPKIKPQNNARGGFSDPDSQTKLVVATDVPQGYTVNSITPNKNGTPADLSDDYLNFWFTTKEESSVKPEVDKLISAWKACMTEISAGAMGLSGTIGGETYIDVAEEVTNFLYCQLDEDIHSVISEPKNPELEPGDEGFAYAYEAPVVDPTGKLPEEEKYQRISPIYVGEKTLDQVTSEHDYEITNKVYYVTTALADTWMNFCMPFDVEKIWVVESYSETEIEKYFNNLKATNETASEEDYVDPFVATRKFQAKHNADFAAFFGVAMAIGADNLTFEGIYNNYIDWAMKRADAVYFNQETGEQGTGLYKGGDYTLRGKYALKHYDGTNFKKANYYLYKNTADWTMVDDETFETHWQVVPKVAEGGAIMNQGEVYSMLFPYCLGCDTEIDDEGNVQYDENDLPIINERDYWDYWTGKFLIFESTTGPHKIKGANYVSQEKQGASDWFLDGYESVTNKAALLGNSTFAMMNVLEHPTMGDNIYTYLNTDRGREAFLPYNSEYDGETINPTGSFLLANFASPAKMITRSGMVIPRNPSGNGGTATDVGNVPTISYNQSLFLTPTATGINIEVATPQYVRVITTTGAIIFSGMIENSANVVLPFKGVYVVSGENEVQKILY